jgi:uncharacterized damage-inducible protein DinB
MDTQPDSTFLEFIRYNNWANQKVIEACRHLSEEQLDMSIPGSYGTIRDTLSHIIRAEASYVGILTGSKPMIPLKKEDRPSVAEMAGYAAEVARALVEMAQQMRPTDQVDEEDNGKQFRYGALALFIQIIDHGIEHRTNITTILNGGLQTPPDIDGWAYLEAHPERFQYTITE